MPEGPEIRRAADRLADAIRGQRAERVRFGLARLQEHEEELRGRRVLSVEPRGKALLTAFEGERWLYSHNQLYGRWQVVKPERLPNTRRSLRVAIETPKAWALLFSASDIDVLDRDGLESHPFLCKLGPDVLAPRTTPARIAKRLEGAAFRGRSLGALLLDQGFVGGLGNYLRSEILFFSGLRPECRPRDLDSEERALLARSVREVTRRSYRTGGLTELPDLVRIAKAAGEPRRFHRHAVFARAGKPCRRCGSRIEKLEVGGRRLYLCPVCQPARS